MIALFERLPNLPHCGTIALRKSRVPGGVFDDVAKSVIAVADDRLERLATFMLGQHRPTDIVILGNI